MKNYTDIYFYIIIHRKIEVENIFHDDCLKFNDVVSLNDVVFMFVVVCLSCGLVLLICVIFFLFNDGFFIELVVYSHPRLIF
ncbi:unnamed protein product [Prunus brigantina]